MSAMTIYERRQTHALDFHVNLKSSSVMKQLGFLILLTIKFDGERKNPSKHGKHEGKPHASILIIFDDYENWQNALDHCRNHLTPSGKVSARYRGALDYADKGGVEAAYLMEQIRAAEFSN